MGFLDKKVYENLTQESYQVLGLINRLLDSFGKSSEYRENPPHNREIFITAEP